MMYLALTFSVLVGIGIAYVFKPKGQNIQLLLAFSGAYLLSVIALHLLPEVFQSNSNTNIGIYILLGLLLQIILDFFSKGADHGHIHDNKSSNFPVILFISLCLHAFMEGIPIHYAHDSLAYGIIVHKIPVAVVLTAFFMKSSYKKSSIAFFLLCFAIMTPLGSFVGEHFSLINEYKQPVTAIIIGILLHIATIILFESSKNHQFNVLKFLAILLGFVLGIFT